MTEGNRKKPPPANSSLALIRLSLRPAVTLVRLTPATLPTNFANAARLMTRILARGAIPRLFPASRYHNKVEIFRKIEAKYNENEEINQIKVINNSEFECKLKNKDEKKKSRCTTINQNQNETPCIFHRERKKLAFIPLTDLTNAKIHSSAGKKSRRGTFLLHGASDVILMSIAVATRRREEKKRKKKKKKKKKTQRVLSNLRAERPGEEAPVEESETRATCVRIRAEKRREEGREARVRQIRREYTRSRSAKFSPSVFAKRLFTVG
ncbi:hypothetical protein PUN28_011081 [Cardiocondyla obscurior]|uniref:Uncharacterized protein n=1 Tax=Cardiocondyla obscurior TaxID=286306 RepID=A0AAW2FLJ1_9HYME